MSALKSDFLRTLEARGFIHQLSDAAGLDAKCLAGPIAAYIGFDCTADSMSAAWCRSCCCAGCRKRATSRSC